MATGVVAGRRVGIPAFLLEKTTEQPDNPQSADRPYTAGAAKLSRRYAPDDFVRVIDSGDQ